MERIVSFGCSFTYGLGLNDCYNAENHNLPGPNPSKYAWPSILAAKLNWDCRNEGIVSASNFEILLKILESDFNETDRIIVMWSSSERDLLLLDNNETVQIASYMIDDRFSNLFENVLPTRIGKFSFGGSDQKKLAEMFFKVHSKQDLECRSWIYQYLAGLHLKKKKNPFIFINAWNWSRKNIPTGVFNFLSLDIEVGYIKVDTAINGLHPGPETHELIAEMILKSPEWQKMINI